MLYISNDYTKKVSAHKSALGHENKHLSCKQARRKLIGPRGD